MSRRGIVFSAGTSAENEAAAAAVDDIVFPVLVPNPGPGTVAYEAPVAHPDWVQWCYPVDEDSEPIAAAAGHTAVDVQPLGFFPPPTPPS
jgi:hypothetical protein